MKLKFSASRPQGSAFEGVQKCPKNVSLMWVSVNFGKFLQCGRENLQVSHGFTHSSRFPTGRLIGQLRPTHTKNLLFIFPQCTHTHPHCPVPTSLDSVMTTIQQSMML